MTRTYAIDGVAVPKRVWECRRIFGEYVTTEADIVAAKLGGYSLSPGARFEVFETRDNTRKDTKHR